MPAARGQGRGNSGVYQHGRYEIQVLDSFGLTENPGECGAIYGQKAADVNARLPPGQWQTYDIDFKAPQFDADGKQTKGAVITVLDNGVKVHRRGRDEERHRRGLGPAGQDRSDPPAGPRQPHALPQHLAGGREVGDSATTTPLSHLGEAPRGYPGVRGLLMRDSFRRAALGVALAFLSFAPAPAASPDDAAGLPA